MHSAKTTSKTSHFRNWAYYSKSHIRSKLHNMQSMLHSEQSLFSVSPSSRPQETSHAPPQMRDRNTKPRKTPTFGRHRLRTCRFQATDTPLLCAPLPTYPARTCRPSAGIRCQPWYERGQHAQKHLPPLFVQMRVDLRYCQT